MYIYILIDKEIRYIYIYTYMYIYIYISSSSSSSSKGEETTKPLLLKLNVCHGFYWRLYSFILFIFYLFLTYQNIDIFSM